MDTLRVGATHVIDNRRDDVASRIRDITGAGVDYVVETTGNRKMHRLAIDALNPHGIVGLLTGETGTDFLPDGRKTLGIIQGDAIPQSFVPKLIELYRAGQFPFDRLVKFYDFSEINKAIADAKRGDTIKPVLQMRVGQGMRTEAIASDGYIPAHPNDIVRRARRDDGIWLHRLLSNGSQVAGGLLQRDTGPSRSGGEDKEKDIAHPRGSPTSHEPF